MQAIRCVHDQSYDSYNKDHARPWVPIEDASSSIFPHMVFVHACEIGQFLFCDGGEARQPRFLPHRGQLFRSVMCERWSVAFRLRWRKC